MTQQDSGMPVRPKMKMEVYSHAINNNARFGKGFLIGVSTGLAIFIASVILAYAFNLNGTQPMIDGLFQKIVSGNWRS